MKSSMLLSKLLVPFNIVQNSRGNLFKLQNCLSRTKCSVAENGKLCPKPYNTINIRKSRSEKYNEMLQRCSKPENDKECGSKRPGDSQSKCPQRHAAEVYTSAFTEVTKSALKLQVLARNSVNAIASSMQAAIAERVKSERNRINCRLVDVASKIKEIQKMSLVCADSKTNEGYAIGEWIHANFYVWQCENESGVHCVKCRLHDLECRVKERTETAIEIVTTCKGCLTPEGLIKHVDISAKDSESILKATKEYLKKEIACIEQVKAQVLQENDKIVGDLMTKFEKEVAKLIEQLDICIEELKKMQK